MPQHAALAAVALLLIASNIEAEEKRDEGCRHCTSPPSGNSTNPGDARLVSGCKVPARIGSLSAAERSRYCRWVVRVTSTAAERERRVSPEDSAETAAIAAVLAPLRLVQPPQFRGGEATVLAERTVGAYEVVTLSRENGTWKVGSILEVAAGPKPGR